MTEIKHDKRTKHWDSFLSYCSHASLKQISGWGLRTSITLELLQLMFLYHRRIQTTVNLQDLLPNIIRNAIFTHASLT